MKFLAITPMFLALIACQDYNGLRLHYDGCFLPMEHMDDVHRGQLDRDTRVVQSNRMCVGTYKETPGNTKVDSVSCTYTDHMYGDTTGKVYVVTGVGTQSPATNPTGYSSECEYKIH